MGSPHAGVSRIGGQDVAGHMRASPGNHKGNTAQAVSPGLDVLCACPVVTLSFWVPLTRPWSLVPFLAPPTLQVLQKPSPGQAPLSPGYLKAQVRAPHSGAAWTLLFNLASSWELRVLLSTGASLGSQSGEPPAKRAVFRIWAIYRVLILISSKSTFLGLDFFICQMDSVRAGHTRLC